MNLPAMSTKISSSGLPGSGGVRLATRPPFLSSPRYLCLLRVLPLPISNSLTLQGICAVAFPSLIPAPSLDGLILKVFPPFTNSTPFPSSLHSWPNKYHVWATRPKFLGRLMDRLVVIRDYEFTEELAMVRALILFSRLLLGVQSKNSYLTGSTEGLGIHRLLAVRDLSCPLCHTII